MSQLVILLRYVNSSGPVERFISFGHILDRTSKGLASALKQELEPYNHEQKLIAQSYDGAPAFVAGTAGSR